MGCTCLEGVVTPSAQGKIQGCPHLKRLERKDGVQEFHRKKADSKVGFLCLKKNTTQSNIAIQQTFCQLFCSLFRRRNPPHMVQRCSHFPHAMVPGPDHQRGSAAQTIPKKIIFCLLFSFIFLPYEKKACPEQFPRQSSKKTMSDNGTCSPSESFRR